MAVFQWPQRVGPASVASGSDSCLCHAVGAPATACGAALLGAGLPKLAGHWWPDPHRLADLQRRPANRQRWLRAGSIVLGFALLDLLLDSHKAKVVDPAHARSPYASLLLLHDLRRTHLIDSEALRRSNQSLW